MPCAHVNDVALSPHLRGEGFPSALAHGYCGRSDVWRHQVIAYGARGHGRGAAPAGQEHL